MKKLTILLALAGILTSCGDSGSNSGTSGASEAYEDKSIAKNVDVTEFKQLAGSGNGTLLDVRTPEEVAQGVIAGATHINIHDADFQAQVGKLDKSKPVYVYCKSGGRSGQAMEQMKEMGFTEIYNLDGGITAWKAEGNETVTQ